jgi:hypothetical protein
MSAWTHVVGCFRVDGFPTYGDTPSKIKDILGPIDTFETHFEDCKLPTGSEGSLEYHIHEYGTGLPWVVISIWGDLRDYSDFNQISMWWSNILSHFDLLRDAVLRVEIEGEDSITLTQDRYHG